ncbi:hypothetical protein HD806DRAFT_487502 [Xylariaceae sp. AK1471]|nr:hypothetical protein HD806DRAFT_487502 [Xylariaceae sp. AK1471]
MSLSITLLELVGRRACITSKLLCVVSSVDASGAGEEGGVGQIGLTHPQSLYAVVRELSRAIWHVLHCGPVGDVKLMTVTLLLEGTASTGGGVGVLVA